MPQIEAWRLVKASLPYLLALFIGSYMGYKWEHSDYIQANNALSEYKASSVNTSLEGKVLVLATTLKLSEEIASKAGQIELLQTQLTEKEASYAIERKTWMSSHPLPTSCVFDDNRMQYIKGATAAANNSIASGLATTTK